MPTWVVNTHEAKSRLSELIRDAERGVDVIVARNGEPVARIVPWSAAPAVRRPGVWSGRITYTGDVVVPDPDVASMFGETGVDPT